MITLEKYIDKVLSPMVDKIIKDVECQSVKAHNMFTTWSQCCGDPGDCGQCAVGEKVRVMINPFGFTQIITGVI